MFKNIVEKQEVKFKDLEDKIFNIENSLYFLFIYIIQDFKTVFYILIKLFETFSVISNRSKFQNYLFFEMLIGLLSMVCIILKKVIKFFWSDLVSNNPISIHLYTATFVTLLLNNA